VKHAALLFFTVYAISAHATWSALAHVTPETQDKYNVRVCIADVPWNKPTVDVFVWFPTPRGSGWIITTREYVQPNEQGFRRYIWNNEIEESPIESISAIEYDEVKIPTRTQVTKGLLSRSYLYFDAPTPIFDGGYYFSIDLSTYADHVQTEC